MGFERLGRTGNRPRKRLAWWFGLASDRRSPDPGSWEGRTKSPRSSRKHRSEASAIWFGLECWDLKALVTGSVRFGGLAWWFA